MQKFVSAFQLDPNTGSRVTTTDDIAGRVRRRRLIL